VTVKYLTHEPHKKLKTNFGLEKGSIKSEIPLSFWEINKKYQ
jgi:hypothetical protein